MGRWLSKAEMDRRDKKVVELYQLGLTLKAIAESTHLSGVGAVTTILTKYGVKRTRRRGMSKDGRERRVGSVLQVWIVCPVCGCGRWVQKGNTERPGYTGRCKSCYIKVASQEIGVYYV